MRVPWRRSGLEVARGERVLAWATTAEGTVVGGTRDAAYLPARLAWEQIETASWDRDASQLSVVGLDGTVHRVAIEEQGRFLELLRERVTASVVLQRHVAVDARRGLRVVGRRPPRGDRPITWSVAYDEGVDPDDALVRIAAAEAVAAARVEVGESAGG